MNYAVAVRPHNDDVTVCHESHTMGEIDELKFYFTNFHLYSLGKHL